MKKFFYICLSTLLLFFVNCSEQNSEPMKLTIQILDTNVTDHSFNKLVEIINERGSRAKAREKGIREVKTEWFMFADSDVILCKKWFEKAVKHINKNVGAVWGLNIDVIPKVRNKLFLKSLSTKMA